MDTFCTRCGEPWDTYHMRHDEVYETAHPHKDLFTGTSQDLTEDVRRDFRVNGWEFGSNVLVIKRCPACPKEPTEEMVQRGKEKFTEVETVASMLGDDLDALASSIEDFFGR